MVEKTLAQKLLIKPGNKVLVLNAPAGYVDRLNPLPEGATVTTTPGKNFDVVLAFMHNKAEVDSQSEHVVQAVKYDGLLWFAYPKKTSKIKTDITRDIGWEKVRGMGLEGVAMVAVDDTWSAMRYRPKEKVKQ